MTLAEVEKILEAEVLCGHEHLDASVDVAFGSDLLSDSLAFARPRSLLLTGLTNPQVIWAAEVIEVTAIVFVRGKRPSRDLVKLAEEKGIPLMVTSKLLFDSCGLLYQAGLRGTLEHERKP